MRVYKGTVYQVWAGSGETTRDIALSWPHSNRDHCFPWGRGERRWRGCRNLWAGSSERGSAWWGGILGEDLDGRSNSFRREPGNKHHNLSLLRPCEPLPGFLMAHLAQRAISGHGSLVDAVHKGQPPGAQSRWRSRRKTWRHKRDDSAQVSFCCSI